MNQQHDTELDLDRDARDLLIRRSLRLRKRMDSGEREDGRWAAEFPLGGDTYALALETLTSCLPLRDVTPVPLSSPGVVGVMRWEGSLIPVFSLAAMLGEQGWKTDPSVLLVLTLPSRTVAVDCETVPRSVLLPLDNAADLDAGSPTRLVHLKDRRPLTWIHMEALVRTFLEKGQS